MESNSGPVSRPSNIIAGRILGIDKDDENADKKLYKQKRVENNEFHANAKI